MTRQVLYNIYGERAYEDGLKVYTTIDAQKQIAAAQGFKQGLEQYDKKEDGVNQRKT